MSCGSGCCGTSGSSGCSKMNVYDWLQEMERPNDGFDAIEIKFKGGRKAYYRNKNHLNIVIGDAVVVDAAPGHDVGYVSASGEIVRLQLRKNKIDYNDDLKVIYRLANERDLEKYQESKNREMTTLYRTREICKELALEMKVSDVEYQGDNTKAIFYYSAEDRVDFRELIKRLATEFKIKVEMKQISLRQEAGRLGGIGSCGRELCCSTWLTDFKNVSTSAARYQKLSLNPSKLSGQCGRLKCCLNYELDTYMDALSYIPEVKGKLKTEKGHAKLQKTDIFKKKMWFSFENESDWFPLSVDRVKEIIDLNAKGIIPFSLEQNTVENEPDSGPINDDLRTLDKKFKKKSIEKRKAKQEKKAQPSNQITEHDKKSEQVVSLNNNNKKKRKRPPHRKNNQSEGNKQNQ